MTHQPPVQNTLSNHIHYNYQPSLHNLSSCSDDGLCCPHVLQIRVRCLPSAIYETIKCQWNAEITGA